MHEHERQRAARDVKASNERDRARGGEALDSDARGSPAAQDAHPVDVLLRNESARTHGWRRGCGCNCPGWCQLGQPKDVGLEPLDQGRELVVVEVRAVDVEGDDAHRRRARRCNRVVGSVPRGDRSDVDAGDSDRDPR
jgi:hypothetical protein